MIPRWSKTWKHTCLENLIVGRQRFLESFFESDSEDDIGDLTQLDEKISQELLNYSAIKLSKEQKDNTHLLKWWRDHKTQFPCLVEAVKALLHTPATSVPSERIFSEAGYIARARRSKILPRNLNKFIFIKKNMKYIPEVTKEHLLQEMADDQNPELINLDVD